MMTAMVDKIVTIKTQHKTLERIHTAKIIEDKTNKIPHKTLEGIFTPKYQTYTYYFRLKWNNSIKFDIKA